MVVVIHENVNTGHKENSAPNLDAWLGRWGGRTVLAEIKGIICCTGEAERALERMGDGLETLKTSTTIMGANRSDFLNMD